MSYSPYWIPLLKPASLVARRRDPPCTKEAKRTGHADGWGDHHTCHACQGLGGNHVYRTQYGSKDGIEGNRSLAQRLKPCRKQLGGRHDGECAPEEEYVEAGRCEGESEVEVQLADGEGAAEEEGVESSGSQGQAVE